MSFVEEATVIYWWNPVFGTLTMTVGFATYDEDEDTWCIGNNLTSEHGQGSYIFVRGDWVEKVTELSDKPKLRLLKGGKNE